MKKNINDIIFTFCFVDLTPVRFYNNFSYDRRLLTDCVLPYIVVKSIGGKLFLTIIFV